MRMNEENTPNMSVIEDAIDIDWHSNPACGLCHAIDGLTLALVPIGGFLEHYLPGLPTASLRVARPLTITAGDFTRPLLAPAELERVNAFKSRKRQAEWMAGRLAAKTLAALSAPASPAPCAIEIAYHPEGAPYLEHRPELSLSISHAHDYAVAGLGHRAGMVIGLDLEKKRPLEIDYILHTAFSDRERRRLDPADQDRFFACWTLKEAYLKYLGRGFRESLKRVEILDDTIIRHHGQTAAGLSVQILHPFPDYFLAIVYGPQPI
jgi:4'-phosphopantetheinyl transferase